MTNSDCLRIDFWDVGHGDASVIWLDNGSVILIDCGPHNSLSYVDTAEGHKTGTRHPYA